jgi:hypothetical protein
MLYSGCDGSFYELSIISGSFLLGFLLGELSSFLGAVTFYVWFTSRHGSFLGAMHF